MLKGIVLIALGCGLVIFWLLHGSDTEVPPAPPPVLTTPSPVLPTSEQQPFKEALAIEAERNQLDQTVWAQELLAQKHEDVFVKLWDSLRASAEPLDVLAQFAFDELILGQPTAPISREHDITQVRLTDPGRRLTPGDWRHLVTQFKNEGYRLDQSEWRHPHFEARPDGTVRSVIAMALHLSRRTPQQRVIVEGNLNIHWRENPDPAELPFPAQIEATALDVRTQQGQPAFEQALAKEIKTELNPVFIDPLIVHDLTGDGLSEIILVGQNVLFRNLGNGRFQAGKLWQEHAASVNTAILADFNGDAALDLLGVDRDGLLMWSGDPLGRFTTAPKRVRFTPADLANPYVMTAGDVDADGDLDVWLAQYKLPYVAGQMPTPYYDANDGFPSFLLLNDGTGNFRDATAESNLAKKRFRRTYSASFVDLDEDLDLDLLVVSDFAGVDLHYNDGSGRFIDPTESALPERHAFGMSHTFGDYNLDGRLDFLAIGMNSFTADRLDGMGLALPNFAEHRLMRPRMAYGNHLYFGAAEGWQKLPMSAQIARSGWSWGATSFDFDNDGDQDVSIVNGHKSRASAKDYETQFWRHDIVAATSRPSSALDIYFRSVGTRLYGSGYSYGGYEKNRLFLNERAENFLEIGFLAGLALEKDCRNLASDDLDHDGKPDLILTTMEVWPEDRQGIQVFRNRFEQAGNWIGVTLSQGAKGFSPVGAKISVAAGGSTQARRLVTGDSHRTQHASAAHFGLGSLRQVDRIEVRWPNGRVQILSQPAINQYHKIQPEDPVPFRHQ